MFAIGRFRDPIGQHQNYEKYSWHRKSIKRKCHFLYKPLDRP